MDREEPLKKWARVVAKAWADEEYKKRLLAVPASVLAEEDLSPPEGVTVTIVENTPTHVHMILPSMPKDATGMEMIEERKAAGLFDLFYGIVGANIFDIVH